MPKEKLLKPITHRRYITCYCIADLEVGSVPIKDTFGNTITNLTQKSKDKLIMEGTGRLPSSDLVNVAARVDGEMTFVLVPHVVKYGYGIKGKYLQPWVSTAINLIDIRCFNLFKKTIVFPELAGYKTPYGSKELTGIFEVHDTGSGLRQCPYEKGLFRSGETDKKCGQVDIFVGEELVYKKLFGNWKMYQECFIMPLDTYTPIGIQETLNLLIDAGLDIDGKIGPKTYRAINDFKRIAGLEEDHVWCDKTKDFAKRCLENWR